MADSPERILASYRKQPEQLYAYPLPSEGQVEFQYIRADVARADAELAVAEALKRAADVGKMVGDGHYGDEVRAAILALAPADALAEVRRLREALQEIADTHNDQWHAGRIARAFLKEIDNG